MSSRVPPFDFSRLSREPLGQRGGKAKVEQFAKPTGGRADFAEWFDHLPKILAGAELHDLVEAIAKARAALKPVHWAMGAHVVKVGLGPVIADLIERRIITAVSVNGAFVVHDYEIAAVGFTSEDVDAALPEGAFGMSEETGQACAEMVALADRKGGGLGEACAEFIATAGLPHAAQSVLANCHRYEVPVTVHAALGTDIVHMHPELEAAAFGRALMRDFEIFTTLVSYLQGGVYLNIGSAVLLPEVFLKALSAVRNTGVKVDNITTANLDFIRQYRPLTNVVGRPVARGGRGINLVGHHEIMVPLLAAAVCHRLWMPAEDG
ncbi:MAG: hypothetical protein ACTSXZ_04505 [Alphaproteobacteria bacterium]